MFRSAMTKNYPYDFTESELREGGVTLSSQGTEPAALKISAFKGKKYFMMIY
ncbi:MAG: hypothetical protein WA667_22170 [Candidatus Nitrosopolaris sp.]